MGPLTIHRLHTRLRLPATQADEAARLRRLLGRLVDTALEPALERAGFDDRGELCIRRIDLPPLPLDLSATDAAIVERWAQAWAAAIVRRVARVDAGIVRYTSRVRALIDLVESAARGDFTRAWAWRQLGLWSADDALTESDAAGLVLRALTAEARHAAAALAWFAGRGPLFDRWLGRCGDDALLRLAQAVLDAAGGAVAVAVAALDSLRAGQAAGSALAPDRRLAQVFEHAALAQALLRQPPGTTRVRRSALAVWAIAECEPGWLRLPRDELTALIADLCAAMRHDRISAVDGSAQVHADSLTARVADRDPAKAASVLDPAQASARPAGRPAAPGTAREGRSREREPARSPGPQSQPQPAQAVEAPPTDIRQNATTAFGGLLYLLNLAAELGWPEQLLRDPVFAPRGLRWTLHRLATTLLPVAADDPAALAFVGLRPGDLPPGDGDRPPDDTESAALAGLRAELIVALRRRLRHADGVAEADDQHLLVRVCRRRAEVFADPGWIELHLSLEDVRTEIRAAGLDLDPGWLPWLGVVVRFVYA